MTRATATKTNWPIREWSTISIGSTSISMAVMAYKYYVIPCGITPLCHGIFATWTNAKVYLIICWEKRVITMIKTPNQAQNRGCCAILVVVILGRIANTLSRLLMQRDWREGMRRHGWTPTCCHLLSSIRFPWCLSAMQIMPEIEEKSGSRACMLAFKILSSSFGIAVPLYPIFFTKSTSQTKIRIFILYHTLRYPVRFVGNHPIPTDTHSILVLQSQSLISSTENAWSAFRFWVSANTFVLPYARLRLSHQEEPDTHWYPPISINHEHFTEV